MNLPQNFKIQVTPEQSEILQKYMFGLGYKWGDNKQSVNHTAFEYLFFNNKYIYVGVLLETFIGYGLQEITFSQFQEMTKEIKTEINVSELAPEGYELDKKKSSIEKIVFKKKEDGFSHLPMSVNEIKGRNWFIGVHGKIIYHNTKKTNNDVSSKERAEAFLALMQLIELRDAWNEGWKANWDRVEEYKYCIEFRNGKKINEIYSATSRPLSFKTHTLRDKFSEQFNELIETAKELL